jgi:type I restriction enzyme R subunit
LFERGWTRTDIRVEETAAPVDIIEKRGQRRPKGRTDYVLRRPLRAGGEPMPLAILEAKREDLPPEHGLQQGRGYRIGHLHHVPFVFSSNGHLFVEYDEESGQTSDPRPMEDFPTPDELVARALRAQGLNESSPDMVFFDTPYAQGRTHLRYYQDAAIRAAMGRIIRHRMRHEPPRALLSLATGSGKTRIAAAFLRRLFDAGLMGKALFVCDRTELRDNGLGDFQAAFGNNAAEVDTKHPQKNARVLIATYQTLDDEQEGMDQTFFLRHYPPGFFDAIVIDECHRSAWGHWHVILEKNPDAIQIGLTATPRQIRVPETADLEVLQKVEFERRLLADNIRYFGEPAYVYEYMQGVADGYLAPADIETFDIFHDRKHRPERIRGVRREDVKNRRISDALTGRRLTPEAVAQVNEGSSLEARLFLPERVKAMCAHLFGRLLENGEGDPLQKTMVFCASDAHADQVAKELNNIYHRWCSEKKARRVPTFAFKCMASVNGQALIPDFRGRGKSHFIATTKDLLTTGVNVPCVENIVLFRYVQSSILFHQMVGRGTRLDGEKLMFRILDYTGATALFGADFKTPPPPPGGEGTPPPRPKPRRVKVTGVEIKVADAGTFSLLAQDGRPMRVTPRQYQQRLVEELTATVPVLQGFRERWIEPESRKELLKQLERDGLIPEKIRKAAHMEEYDLFDVMAAAAYGITPRTRSERIARVDAGRPEWLIRLPQPTTRVVRAILRQFERAGAEALEARELWQTPELKKLRGLQALREEGDPKAIMKKLKEDLFAA